MLFLQRPIDETWRQLLLVFLFVVLPLLARVFRALVEKLNKNGGAGPTAAEERRARREERRRAESEGGEIWRRLLEGEEEAPAPPPRPARRREPVRRPSATEASAPDPLSVLGRAERIPEAALPEAALAETALAEVSLESAEVAPPLDALAHPGAEAPSQRERRSRASLLALGDRSELARAIVLAEVLGPPLSQR